MTASAPVSTPCTHAVNMINIMDVDQIDLMDLVPPSSSPSTSASKLIASSRRGVSFSPQPETKYFNADDWILPEDGQPPLSIRSYALSDPASPAPAGRASPRRRDTPTLFRSVLKHKVHDIRIARTVEEGTLNNREAARLLVTGRRPGLVARDSFQLAQMRKGTDEVSLRAGKEGEVAMPASDDSVGSEEGERDSSPLGSEEEEEQVEQDGALTTSSLVDIVLNGAEDLLTLEEAYKTLILRLRQRIPLEEEICNDVSAYEMEISLRPIKDEAPAMVRALRRDMGRLLGKVPNSEFASPDRSSSPFKALQPLHDSTPINRRQTPSPTPTPTESKELKPSRQGYSEAEVRYRRESAGVGQAAIGMLGLIFERRPISTCFTEADMQSLLDDLLMVPRTPNMPTPNPKRTYFAATMVLSNMRIPSACVNPIRDKIVRGIESMTSETFGSGGIPIRDLNFKKEVYNAIAHLMTEYPSIFFAYYAELLAPSLRAVASPSIVVRQRATSAVTAFAAAKIAIRKAAREKAFKDKTTAAHAEWVRLRQLVSKSEVFVANHLKRVPPLAGRAVYTQDGERRTEWLAIDKLIKEKMTTDVYWGCAVWASLVTLVGDQYASFGLAGGSSGFNNIMAKSLQISSNTTRATLARLAWNHAIHAYLVAGSAQSIDSNYQLVQSYKPFATVGNQESLDRLETILMPVTAATSTIHASDSWSRSSGPSTRYQSQERCFWQRTEKGKKAMWLSTCGESAASVVYAFVGTALSHRDQPAKEMTLISGLPSSDGIPIPESSIAASTQDRLDRTWDQVVLPILRNLVTLYGVDKLKLHGWSILESLTKPETKYTETWDIDRLLCAGYLTGEALLEKLKDKEVGSMFVDDVERDSISPKDVPPMGNSWIIRRLESVLNLFQLAIAGISGLSDLYGVEAIDLGQGVLFPVTLTAIWSALLSSINDIREIDPAAYTNGVRLVTRHLCQVFNGSPASYLPISLMAANEQWTVDLDSVRILVFSHLFTLAHETLHCEGVSKALLSGTGDAIDAAMSERAFGTDPNGSYTMAGSLLSMLMSTTLFSNGLAVPARTALQRVVFRLINGSFVSDKLLGDMTNRLHSVYEDREEIQLDFWRALASRWTKSVNTDRQTTGGTNHTGALLVSLLSNPFRGKHLQSVWHQDAGESELKTWSGLLEVVVARFRLKGVGPNLGVLESLAGHLGDFFIDSDRACTSTITLSCLTALASHISCSQLSHHVDDHFSINENYVPLDFLTLVSDALTQSYPGTATLDELSKEDAVSSAVYTLLSTLQEKFETLPTEFALQAFEAVREGLGSWLSDFNKVVNQDDAPGVDQLYITLLSLFGRSLEQGLLPRTADGFDKLLDIIAPRLSRAVSRAVPEAFQRLWSHFSVVRFRDFSQDARTFLEEVVAAAPGLIDVQDMAASDDMAEDDSLARYPHAREAGSLSQAQVSSQGSIPLVPETQEEPTESLAPVVDISTEYDADMSASLDKPEQTSVEERPAEAHVGFESSPAASISGTDVSSRAEEVSDATTTDVFGPASSLPKPTPKKRGRRKASKSSSARSSKSSRSRSSTADLDVKPSVAIEADNEISEEIVAVQPNRKVARSSSKPLYELQPAPTRDAAGKAGFISSASKWMSRLPTLGGLFSPSRHAFDTTINDAEEDEEVEELSPAASGRKRKVPHQLGRSYSQPELSAITRAAQIKRPAVAMQSDSSASRSAKRSRISHTQSDTAVVVVDSDSEDELLLSPETAKQRRAEEEQASKALADAEKSHAIDTQHSTGRFDDAPTPNPRAFPANAVAGPSSIAQPDASPVRTVNHARLLEMVQAAERQKQLVESMTFDDLDAFNVLIDTLQIVGKGAMRTRMTALRRDKKKDGRK